ncbi:MAG TPA: hypothetical protein VM347_07270 [Nonomuraea sp.]|nr:hypothetical protein [Nonomuraea sp.]
MPVDLADAAYGHCLTVTRDEPAAVEAAVAALGRGSRTRTGALAHARHEALARGAGPATHEADIADLTALAWWLTGTRPAVERAVVDLDARHQLSRGELGRVLGIAPAAAATLAADYAASWDHELGPAVMAWLGPGECDELAALLDARDCCAGAPATEVWAVAPAVAEHADGCSLCGDRRRSLATVRSIVGQIPFDAAPPEVKAMAAVRRRIPASPPPPILPNRNLTWGLRAVCGAVALLLVVAGVTAVSRRDGTSRAQRVAALTRVGPAALALSPRLVDLQRGYFQLQNVTDEPVRWRAAAAVPWLGLAPSSGRLAPHQSQRIRFKLAPLAPEGDVRTVVTFGAEQGSTVAVQIVGANDEPPEVAASVSGCAVTATAEDAGEVREVVLHWKGAVEGSAPMRRRSATWVGTLPSGLRNGSWFVSAVDARGNRGGTAIQPVPAACR